jgi:DNA-binding CsgD family transcriptional regulator
MTAATPWTPWTVHGAAATRPASAERPATKPLPDPAALSQAERRALALLAGGQPLHRRMNGWGVPPRRISLKTAESLFALGLARAQAGGLILTGAGRTVAALMSEGKRK